MGHYPKNSLAVYLEVFCTVIKSFQNRIQHALVFFLSDYSIVARKDPIIAYFVDFIGAALSTMHFIKHMKTIF